jgi:multidrug efflux pump
VPGVGLVSIAGNVRPAVRIQVNPAQLSNMGLTLEKLRSALTQANVNAPKGSLNGLTQSYSIGTNDQLTDAAEYRTPSSPTRTTRRCGCRTWPKWSMASRTTSSAWADGKPRCCWKSAASRRQHRPDRRDMRKLLPQLQSVLPAGRRAEVFSDRTETIRASVHDVQFTLMLTIGLVVAVIFVFLRRLWATIIPRWRCRCR